jgi:hypothetical protein
MLLGGVLTWAWHRSPSRFRNKPRANGMGEKGKPGTSSLWIPVYQPEMNQVSLLHEQPLHANGRWLVISDWRACIPSVSPAE